MQSNSGSVAMTLAAIAILFKDSSELFQDFNVYLPEGYYVFCPTDSSEVDLWVLATPHGAQIQCKGAHIPAALPTNLVDLRKALSSGNNLTELEGASASVALQLLQLVCLSLMYIMTFDFNVRILGIRKWQAGFGPNSKIPWGIAKPFESLCKISSVHVPSEYTYYWDGPSFSRPICGKSGLHLLNASSDRYRYLGYMAGSYGGWRDTLS